MQENYSEQEKKNWREIEREGEIYIPKNETMQDIIKHRSTTYGFYVIFDMCGSHCTH